MQTRAPGAPVRARSAYGAAGYLHGPDDDALPARLLQPHANRLPTVDEQVARAVDDEFLDAVGQEDLPNAVGQESLADGAHIQQCRMRHGEPVAVVPHDVRPRAPAVERTDALGRTAPDREAQLRVVPQLHQVGPAQRIDASV